MLVLVLSTLKLESNAQSSMKLSDFIELLTQKRIMVVIAFLLFYVAAEAAFLNFFPIFYAALDIADPTPPVRPRKPLMLFPRLPGCLPLAA